jgi:hypothetical protein
VPRVGIEPTLPRRAAALQAAWRTTARPKAISRTDTGGSRTHKPRGLSPVAIPVRVPCPCIHPSEFITHPSKSLRWESNPRFRHTKTAGSRYNTGAYSPNTIARLPKTRERLAGVEPALPTWHAGVLPLTPQARCLQFILHPSAFIPAKEHPAGLEPASPSWEGGMFPLHHGCASTSGTRRARTSTRGIKSPGCCR